MTKQNKNNDPRYFNESKKEITKSINSGKTFLVCGYDYDADHMARQIAVKKNSYCFEVWILKDKKYKRYGWAIPN